MDVFISYRRSDSEGHAGRLYDSIKKDYNVFMDVDQIKTGENFRDTVAGYLAKTECFLCVIGKTWATVASPTGHARLNEPDDPVRVEVEAALERGTALIPVLVWDAVMPNKAELPNSLAEIADIDAFQLSHKQWDNDIDRLRRTIQQRVKASRGRGVSKLGRKWPPLDGATIFVRWLTNDRPPTLVGRSGGIKSSLLKRDIETGGWKSQRYEVSYVAPPDPTPRNWMRIEEFIEQIAPHATKDAPVLKKAAETLSGSEILRLSSAPGNAPTLMSRKGGLDGDPMTDDINSGQWRTRKYQVSYSDLEPPRNWFKVQDFAKRIQLTES